MSRRVAVAVLIILVVGCGGEELPRGGGLTGDPSSTTAGRDQVVTTADAAAVDLAPVDLTILDPGAEPHEQIRLAPEPGTVQRVTLRLDSTQRIETWDGWVDLAVPVFEVDLANTVTRVGGGRITVDQSAYGFRILDERGLEPDLVDELARALDVLVELTRTTIVLDERGALIDQSLLGEGAVYDLPSFEGLVTTTSDASLPLPAEPIGLGARWQVRSDSVVSGMRMVTTTDAELVEVHDDRVVARIHQSVTMPRGFIEGSRDRDEVIRGELGASGTVTWFRQGALPVVDLEGSGTIETRFFRGRQGYRSNVEQHLRTTMILHD